MFSYYFIRFGALCPKMNDPADCRLHIRDDTLQRHENTRAFYASGTEYSAFCLILYAQLIHQ